MTEPSKEIAITLKFYTDIGACQIRLADDLFRAIRRARSRYLGVFGSALRSDDIKIRIVSSPKTEITIRFSVEGERAGGSAILARWRPADG